VACPRRDATDRCDLSPSGGHGQARPAGQRATEILKVRPVWPWIPWNANPWVRARGSRNPKVKQSFCGSGWAT